jgi:hypothetical protein
MTSTKNMECEEMMLPKKLKNPIWLDVLPNLKDLENAQSTMQNLSKG